MGDACDLCDNLNIYVRGNVNGDIENNEPIIDLYDVFFLVDRILDDDYNNENYTGCSIESADFNQDSLYNTLDIILLIFHILDPNDDGRNSTANSANILINDFFIESFKFLKTGQSLVAFRRTFN